MQKWISASWATIFSAMFWLFLGVLALALYAAGPLIIRKSMAFVGWLAVERATWACLVAVVTAAPVFWFLSNEPNHKVPLFGGFLFGAVCSWLILKVWDRIIAVAPEECPSHAGPEVRLLTHD